MRIAAILEYDGARFAGWQRQPHARSVQAVVEAALSRIADEPVHVTVAGRTDAGVHALAQVIHFDTQARRTPRAWVRGATSNLPGEVALLWAGSVGEDFHARFSATARSYRYVILNRPIRPTYLAGRVGWDYRQLDVERMRSAAAHLVGTHDFTSFRALACQAKSPVRELKMLAIERDAELVIVDARANAFLHHMVRNIVGVLTAIGAGEREPEWALEVLAARDRAQGGVTAAAEGLYLRSVHYPPGLPIPVLDRAGFP